VCLEVVDSESFTTSIPSRIWQFTSHYNVAAFPAWNLEWTPSLVAHFVHENLSRSFEVRCWRSFVGIRWHRSWHGRTGRKFARCALMILPVKNCRSLYWLCCPVQRRQTLQAISLPLEFVKPVRCFQQEESSDLVIALWILIIRRCRTCDNGTTAD
jgi:hypothetical protein